MVDVPHVPPKPVRNMLSLLQAAHAIVCTFRVENTCGDAALSYPAIITMLGGVDELLELAESRDSEPCYQQIAEEWKDAHDLPELWMFRPVQATTANIEVASIACCRAQAVIRMMIGGAHEQIMFGRVHEHDVTHTIWAIEGMIAQAISAITVATLSQDRGVAA